MTVKQLILINYNLFDLDIVGSAPLHLNFTAFKLLDIKMYLN